VKSRYTIEYKPLVKNNIPGSAMKSQGVMGRRRILGRHEERVLFFGGAPELFSPV
jgi:hypothetical protein